MSYMPAAYMLEEGGLSCNTSYIIMDFEVGGWCEGRAHSEKCSKISWNHLQMQEKCGEKCYLTKKKVFDLRNFLKLFVIDENKDTT